LGLDNPGDIKANYVTYDGREYPLKGECEATSQKEFCSVQNYKYKITIDGHAAPW